MSLDFIGLILIIKIVLYVEHLLCSEYAQCFIYFFFLFKILLILKGQEEGEKERERNIDV